MSRTLITDDSPPSGIVLAEIFPKLGQAMDTAAQGQKILEKITVNPPDFLLLANKMPVIDRLQTLDALRNRNIMVPINAHR
jgi:CheY-like chemotaxis protein